MVASNTLKTVKVEIILKLYNMYQIFTNCCCHHHFNLQDQKICKNKTKIQEIQEYSTCPWHQQLESNFEPCVLCSIE
jgi:hypothetical protein